MDEFQAAALEVEIRSVAESVARAWPGLTDSDAIQDALWEPLTHEAVASLMGAEPRLRTAALYRAAHKFAQKETLDAQHFGGRVHYSTSAVKRLLDTGILTSSMSELDPTRDSLVHYMDVDRGVRCLEQRHRAVIGQAFFLGEEDIDKRGLNRAIQALTSAMNRGRNR